MPARLVLVCGLPGAGKTTTAVRIAADQGGIRLSPDDWMRELAIDLFDQPARTRIEALQWQLALQLLELGTTVIIEWGLWTRVERDMLREGARRIGVPVELRFLDEPVDVLWKRVRARGREQQWGSRAIERDELVAWAEAFEAPDAEERRLYDERPER